MVSVFRSNDEKVSRRDLEERYAKKQGLGQESGKKAVKEAINLGWIAKTGAEQRAPYGLTGLGIRERGRMPPSLLRPPATSERCDADGILSLDDLFADSENMMWMLPGFCLWMICLRTTPPSRKSGSASRTTETRDGGMGKGAITYAKWNTHYPFTPISPCETRISTGFSVQGLY